MGLKYAKSATTGPHIHAPKNKCLSKVGRGATIPGGNFSGEKAVKKQVG